MSNNIRRERELFRELLKELDDKNIANPGYHCTALVSVDRIASTVQDITDAFGPLVEEILVIPDYDRSKSERFAIYRKLKFEK